MLRQDNPPPLPHSPRVQFVLVMNDRTEVCFIDGEKNEVRRRGAHYYRVGLRSKELQNTEQSVGQAQVRCAVWYTLLQLLRQAKEEAGAL